MEYFGLVLIPLIGLVCIIDAFLDYKISGTIDTARFYIIIILISLVIIAVNL